MSQGCFEEPREGGFYKPLGAITNTVGHLEKLLHLYTFGLGVVRAAALGGFRVSVISVIMVVIIVVSNSDAATEIRVQFAE